MESDPYVIPLGTAQTIIRALERVKFPVSAGRIDQAARCPESPILCDWEGGVVFVASARKVLGRID
jgi:hypothetical protein